MDESQTQANCNGREPLWRTFVSVAKNNKKKHHCHDDFSYECGEHTITAHGDA